MPTSHPRRSSLYRQFYTPAECALIDAAPADDLASEFKLLRVLIFRLLAACQRLRTMHRRLELAVLEAVAGACRTLCRIVRLQPHLLGERDISWPELLRQIVPFSPGLLA